MNYTTPMTRVLLNDLKLTVGVHEDPGRANRGKEVDIYNRFFGLLGVFWCATYEGFKIWKAYDTIRHEAEYKDYKSVWSRLGNAASCGWLVNWLRKQSRLYAEPPNQEVFTFYIPNGNGGFMHTGFGFNLRQGLHKGEIHTIFDTNEGNSNKNGSANGYEVADNTRAVLYGMRFGLIDPWG